MQFSWHHMRSDVPHAGDAANRVDPNPIPIPSYSTPIRTSSFRIFSYTSWR